MSELINRVQCPMGCKNALFTESTKIIVEGRNPLLLEAQGRTVIKVYTCQCCGNTFEMKQNNQSQKNIL
jgi:hypothetical protein